LTVVNTSSWQQTDESVSFQTSNLHPLSRESGLFYPTGDEMMAKAARLIADAQDKKEILVTRQR